jgi:hypothetical protein
MVVRMQAATKPRPTAPPSCCGVPASSPFPLRTMLDDPRDASKETKQTLPRGWSKEGIGARTTYHGGRVSLVADDARRARWQTRSRARA